MLPLINSNSFGIYIHWPFCSFKCPYCDFNSHVREQIDYDDWEKSYLKSIKYYAEITDYKILDSIFFGGGTPSLMKPKTVQAIIDEIAKYWQFSDNIEITLEGNPTSIENGKYIDFKNAGINRVSLGIQSLKDNDLQFLGRQHNKEHALKALDIVKSNFKRFSFDLIYARPEQSLKDWELELTEAMQIAGDHISMYQLTIEKGTKFYNYYKRGDFKMPDQDLAGEMFELTQDILEQNDMPAYEISNHAKSGQESRHNLIYWKYGDYLGIGPGAHGRITRNNKKYATREHRYPEKWLELILDNGNAHLPFEEVSHRERGIEILMMGLRLNDGVEIKTLEQEANNNLSNILDMDKTNRMIDLKLLELDQNRINLTKAGLQRMDGILADIIN